MDKQTERFQEADCYEPLCLKEDTQINNPNYWAAYEAAEQKKADKLVLQHSLMA